MFVGVAGIVVGVAGGIGVLVGGTAVAVRVGVAVAAGSGVCVGVEVAAGRGVLVGLGVAVGGTTVGVGVAVPGTGVFVGGGSAPLPMTLIADVSSSPPTRYSRTSVTFEGRAARLNGFAARNGAR